MSANNVNKTSIIDNMIRPRSVYLTSESVPDDADTSSALYQLSEPIMAEDGHDLVIGVRGFGFNASATNISRKQNNNILSIKIEGLSPAYLPVLNPDSDIVDFIPDTRQPFERKYDIVLPDGLYTVEELFSMLSNTDNYRIPSGYLYDVTYEGSTVIDTNKGVVFDNDILLSLFFEKRDGGFTVRPRFVGVPLLNQYTTSTSYYSAYAVNIIVNTVTIERNQSSPKLYDILFTNRYTEASDHPGYIPQFETNIRGANPPTSIIFHLNISLFDSSKTPDDKETLNQVSVDESVIIQYIDYAPDNQKAISELDKKYPTLGVYEYKRGAVFYHLPLINPLYIDVYSDLQTYNISTNGNLKGLLLRQFALGSVNGSTSFYQSYDTPVFFKSSSYKENIDSIRISFKAEEDKWNFFNMEFYLELLVFEYPKKTTPDTTGVFVQKQQNNGMVFDGEDISMVEPYHNSFPFRHRGNDTSVVYFRDPERTNLKRKEL
jgi:hypothetical protein